MSRTIYDLKTHQHASIFFYVKTSKISPSYYTVVVAMAIITKEANAAIIESPFQYLLPLGATMQDRDNKNESTSLIIGTDPPPTHADARWS